MVIKKDPSQLRVKSASGQKVAVPEVQQVKSVVTHGKHREKPDSQQQPASERVVVENNALANYHEKSAMQKLIDSGEATKESLDAASCALLKCAAEFTEGSAEKAYYEQLEKIGNQPEYAELRDKLRKTEFTVSYFDKISGLNIVLLSTVISI